MGYWKNKQLEQQQQLDEFADVRVIEDVECLTETDRAILCRCPDWDGDKKWIPKSQLSVGTEVEGKDDRGALHVSAWFARKEQL